MSQPGERRTSPLALAAAWIVVAIPLAWGVSQTVVKSIPLFRASAPRGAAPTPAGPAGQR
jgi:hypothetical protein